MPISDPRKSFDTPQEVTWSPNKEDETLRPISEEVSKPSATKVKLKPRKQKSKMARMAKNTKEHDVEWLESQAAEQMDKDLVQYIKEVWNVEPSQTSSLLEVSYRTMELMEKKKPPNFWLSRRGRELFAEHTGLFSDVRIPYQTLGDIELDTDMLVFNNLPPQLKIDPSPWFRMKKEKEDEERRKNAPLPRLPRTKMGRPSYAKGRIKVGAGGTQEMDRFISTAEEFQKGIRGSMTFTQLLNSWREEKENEAANRGSEFGVMKRTQIISTAAPAIPAELDPAKATTEAPKAEELGGKRKSSAMDDRIYQMEMMNLEKMMLAMYDILKSLLNMKHYQLKGNIRLPASVVTSLREHSPETRVKTNKKPPTEIMRRAKFAASIYTSLPSAYSMKMASKKPSMQDPLELSVMNLVPDDVVVDDGYRGTGRVMPTVFDEEAVAEVLPADFGSPTEGIANTVKRVHDVVYSSMYLDDRPDMLKSQTLKRESPEMTIQRILRNDKRYRSIFEPNISEPEAPWHDVRVENSDLINSLAKSETSIRKKSFSAMDFAKERDTSILPYTLKSPHIDDIPTPKLPGPPSLERVDSAEQSRLNLLSKTPGAEFNIPPPAAIRRLYSEAGVINREIDLYKILMKMKTPFRNAEKKIRFFYTNEIEKYEWDTMKRYRTKIAAIKPDPIYEWSIGLMRQAMKEGILKDQMDDGGEKRAAIWYRNLIERCEVVGALKHMGCEQMLLKLHKYCDVDMKSRPMMLNRFCLLVLSLPTTELGTTYFQDAIAFLLDRLFGSPKELLYQWLSYRGLPLLI